MRSRRGGCQNIAIAYEIDYIIVIMACKNLNFHRRLFGIDVLVGKMEENFGSDLNLMCFGLDLAKIRPSFFKWTSSLSI